jgi:CheY-like chemotaxis protein
MNGIEMLQELRADPALQAIPVVVLTTSNDERDRTDAYRLHVAGYLLKPVTFPAFVDLMTLLVKYWTMVETA